MREIWSPQEAAHAAAVASRVGLRLGPQDVDPEPGWLARSRALVLPTEPAAWLEAARPIATALARIGADAVAVLLDDGSGLAPPAIEFRADNPEELALVARRLGAADWVAWVATCASADTWALLSTEWYQLWVGPVELIEAAAGGSLEHGCAEFLRYARTFKGEGPQDIRPWLDEVYRRYCGEPGGGTN